MIYQAHTNAQNDKIILLDSNLYVISLNSVNVLASLGNDGCFVIDAGYEETAGHLLGLMDSLGNNSISLIVNTHWHFDHVGANKILGKSSIIISHKNAFEYLSTNQNVLGNAIKAHEKNVLPNILINNELSLNYNNKEIKIIPLTGAHTDGDLIVYFPAQKTLYLGDIVFADMFPYIDIDHGGNVLKGIENIKYLINNFPEETQYIPGHGRIYSKEDLKNYLNMYEKTVVLIKEEKDKGTELHEIDARSILENWKDFERGFHRENWAEYIYKSL